MRSSRWIGAIFLAGGITTAAGAQTASYSAAVTLPEAEVKCLPGTKEGVYPTNRLRLGQRVEVVKEREDGWLEIKPPDGSFSWISTRFIEPVVANQTNYVVVAYPSVGVPVLMGSEILKKRPSVVGAKLQRGSQIRAIGRPLADEEGTWLPIEPPPGEVRYLRAEAIARAPQPQPPVAPVLPPPAPTVAARVASNPGPGPLGSFQNPTQAGSALAPLADVNGLWNRAVEAERASNTAEAIRLYTQVGNESAVSNRQLAIDAFNRAHYLREANRFPASTFYPAGQGQVLATPATNPPALAIAPVRLSAPVTTGTSYSQPSVTADANGNPSSGPGRLRLAGRSMGSQRLFVLEDGRGLPVVYAAAQPGVDLESYVGRNVELFGPTYYQGSLRANYMSVLRVAPLE